MRKKTILIVDDDMDARLALEKELVAEGYFVFTAYSGNNALCLVRSKCPDLIILDSVLGDMSGKEVRETQGRTEFLLYSWTHCLWRKMRSKWSVLSPVRTRLPSHTMPGNCWQRLKSSYLRPEQKYKSQSS